MEFTPVVTYVEIGTILYIYNLVLQAHTINPILLAEDEKNTIIWINISI